MEWTTLAPVVLSVLTTVGVGELVKLGATRRSRRATDQKVQADTEAVISSELRQWTTQAEARAERAERRAEAAAERATQIEARLQSRIDELVEKLNIAEATADRAEEAQQRVEVSMRRLEERIMACQAGPVCPVRTADTNPRLPAVTPTQV